MNILKRFLAFIVSAMVLSNVFVLAYASESPLDKEGFVYTEVSDNSFLIQDDNGNDIQKITVVENEVERRTTIENLLDGKSEYIVLNKKTREIYSSITGKTIDVSEQNSNISFRSEKSYEKVYISWAEIRNGVGTTASAGTVLGFVLTRIPEASAGSGIAYGISAILGLVERFIPNDSSHGMVFTVKIEKYYRTRLGRRQVWRISKSITAVKRY